MARTLAVVAVLFVAAGANAATYSLESVTAIDGDTIRATIVDQLALEFPGERPVASIRWPNVSIRLAGVDAPETWRPDCPAERARGMAAKAWLDALVAAASSAQLVTDDARERGRFGRVVGSLVLDGDPVEPRMIAAGHAVAYDGGRRAPSRWCPASE